ncbi:hypothetical protein PGT21_014730 [Puccinia graminis f. sp. tritici]|uniref:Uncharacterized protein n=1 Tax=Puccinia graminis f. sp. tritici TaxID=56615 RepID=A0A5B0RMZ7_PUCGR|nr:hypothetical protein PGT21_014730 [Puccinia graminis f. sp. tritici]KAA1126819.1 hypothetical protein PGTUg99_024796 [Puccinia graminis f. sp. tritici]
MSTSSQSDREDVSPRGQQTPVTQEARSRAARSTTARVHSNLCNHFNRRGTPYAPPLRGLRAAAAQDVSSQRPGVAGAEANTQAQAVRAVGTARHFGGPTGGVTRPWPPALVPFEILDNQLNDKFVDGMVRTYDLRAPYDAFAEELIQVPHPRQYGILLYSILSVRQSVEMLIRARDEALAAASTPAAASLSVQARLFVYQRYFRTRAKQILMDPLLEVYSCEPIRGGPPAGRSLLEQVMDHVRIQSDEFKRDYLPLGYATRDPAAEASVATELRDRVKHERGAMRNLLLSMIHDPQGRPITHPVPTLTNLIIDMRTRMLPAGSDDDNLHNDGRWALVDEQLQDLRGRDKLYRRAFFKLIMELDHATFGDKFFSEMDVDSIRPPTEAEVVVKMVLLAAERSVPGSAVE